MTDFETRFGQQLAAWRKSEGVTQAGLARRLGISQQAISRWEKGLDLPDQKHIGTLKDLMRTSSGLAVENAFIQNQSAIRALVNFDGVLILGTSLGFKTVWPMLSRWDAMPLENKLTGESGPLVHSAENRAGVLRGDIVMAGGVSVRHLDLDADEPIKHRWFARFRRIGTLVVADMSFEPCDEETPVGLERLVRLDEISV